MKKTFKKLLAALSETDANISFEVRLWDGETLRFGANPMLFIGAVVVTIVEALPLKIDDNLTVPILGGMAMAIV